MQHVEGQKRDRFGLASVGLQSRENREAALGGQYQVRFGLASVGLQSRVNRKQHVEAGIRIGLVWLQ